MVVLEKLDHPSEWKWQKQHLVNKNNSTPRAMGIPLFNVGHCTSLAYPVLLQPDKNALELIWKA